MDEDKSKAMIPYFCHEGDMARAERTNMRLWILCIILTILFVGSNVFWFYYENQFEDVVETTQEVTQDNDNGINNFIGGNGVITDGEADSKNQNY